MKISTVGIVTALIAYASSSTAAPAEVTEFASLAAEAQEAEAVDAIAAVLEMGRLRDWVDDEAAVGTYQALAIQASNPDVVAIANYAAARILHRTGRFEEADQLIDSMGFVNEWAMIGPFANEGMGGMPERLRPEDDGIFASAIDGKVGQVRWRTFDHPFETGYFAASDFARPSHSALVYLATEFELEEDFEGALSLAVDGAYRLWIDGEPVAEQEEHLGGFLLRDSVPLELEGGRHTMLLKVGAVDGALGLHARLIESDGEPRRVSYRAPDQIPRSAETDDWRSVTTLVERLSNDVSDDDAEGQAALAYIAHATQPSDPLEPWRAFADAALASNPGPRALMRIATTVGEDWRRADLMSQAILIEPTPQRLGRLAVVRYRQMGEEPAQEAAEIAQELSGPDDPAAMLVVWASILSGRGFARAALAELQSRSEPNTMALRTAWIDAARRAGRPDLVFELLEAHLAADVLAAGFYDDYFLALRAAGRESEFWEWLAPIEARLDSMPDAAHQRAWLMRAAGDAEGADQILSDAISLCPGDADLLSVRGNLRMERNLWSQAADDYQAALQLRPQDADLRERLAMLQPAEDQFYEAYRVSIEDVLASRPTEEPDTAYTQLLNQRITRVFDNGLGSTYVQQAFELHTRSGADDLRRLNVVYTPGAERVEVLSASVVKPSGERIEVAAVQDVGGGSGPASVYYDVRMRSVDFSQVEEGDVLVYEYVESEVAAQNMFDDYFGDLWFIEGYTPTVRGRYVLQVPQSRQLFHNTGLEHGVWTESVDGDTRILELEVRNVQPLPREAGAPGPIELFEHASVST
ncbi:MAG: tetratricopeptide (TPR) repeat protein, partial [Bradymonadia bacterium]